MLSCESHQPNFVSRRNVPFVSGSLAAATTAAAAGVAAVNPFQTIERKDVGLTLRIKPQISEGSTIRLEIFQEVSSLDPTAPARSSDLITTKRSLETKVVVDDGNTIVL